MTNVGYDPIGPGTIAWEIGERISELADELRKELSKYGVSKEAIDEQLQWLVNNAILD
jgi:IS1 family transposase